MVEEVIGIDEWVTSCGRGKLKKIYPQRLVQAESI